MQSSEVPWRRSIPVWEEYRQSEKKLQEQFFNREEKEPLDDILTQKHHTLSEKVQDDNPVSFSNLYFIWSTGKIFDTVFYALFLKLSLFLISMLISYAGSYSVIFLLGKFDVFWESRSSFLHILQTLPGNPVLSFGFIFHPLDSNSWLIRAHSEVSNRNSNKTQWISKKKGIYWPKQPKSLGIVTVKAFNVSIHLTSFYWRSTMSQVEFKDQGSKSE